MEAVEAADMAGVGGRTVGSGDGDAAGDGERGPSCPCAHTLSLQGRTRGGRGKMCTQSLKARRVGGCTEKGRYRGSSKEGEIERERERR